MPFCTGPRQVTTLLTLFFPYSRWPRRDKSVSDVPIGPPSLAVLLGIPAAFRPPCANTLPPSLPFPFAGSLALRVLCFRFAGRRGGSLRLRKERFSYKPVRETLLSSSRPVIPYLPQRLFGYAKKECHCGLVSARNAHRKKWGWETAAVGWLPMVVGWEGRERERRKSGRRDGGRRLPLLCAEACSFVVSPRLLSAPQSQCMPVCSRGKSAYREERPRIIPTGTGGIPATVVKAHPPQLLGLGEGNIFFRQRCARPHLSSYYGRRAYPSLWYRLRIPYASGVIPVLLQICRCTWPWCLRLWWPRALCRRLQSACVSDAFLR